MDAVFSGGKSRPGVSGHLGHVVNLANNEVIETYLCGGVKPVAATVGGNGPGV